MENASKKHFREGPGVLVTIMECGNIGAKGNEKSSSQVKSEVAIRAEEFLVSRVYSERAR
jgi:hypothetical protein